MEQLLKVGKAVGAALGRVAKVFAKVFGKLFRTIGPCFNFLTKRFSNFKIGVKLTLGFAIVALIAGAIGLVGTLNIYQINRASQLVYKDNILSSEPLYRLAIQFRQLRADTSFAIIDRRSGSMYEPAINLELMEIDAALNEYASKLALQGGSTGSDQIESLKEYLQKYATEQKAVMDLVKAGKNDAATERMLNNLKPLAGVVASSIDALYQQNTMTALERTTRNNNAAASSTWWMGILVAIGMLVAVGLGIGISRNISKPMRRLTEAAQKLAVGDVDVDVDLTDASKDETGVLLSAFDQMVGSIREQSEVAERLAAGDLNVTVNVRSENDLLAKSIKVVVETLQELVSETNKLTAAAGGGQLAVRGEADRFTGEYRRVVEGINETLDAVIGPLYMAAACVEQIGKGTIPPPITDDYQGDFNTLKNSLNACIEGLGALTECNEVLQKMANNDYTEKVTGDYQGVFGDIATALNLVHDQLLYLQIIFDNMAHGDFGDLTDLKTIGKRSENDQLIPAFIQLMENVLALVNESVRLSESASSGQLETRGDAAQFTGEYRRVIEGFNATLDAVITPLTEAGTVLGRLAVNDYTLEMTGSYQGMLHEFAGQINLVRSQLLGVQDVFIRLSQGDFSRFQELSEVGKRSENDQIMPAVLRTMQVIQDVIDETNRISEAAVAGRLEVRGDSEKFVGKYQAIVVGLNQLLDAMVQPIAEAAAVLDEMAQGNLERRVQGDYQGDYARIKNALNGTIDSFNQILGEINRAAGQVASASRQVSDGSQALSQGATEQAATIQELSASIAEIASQTKENASRAGQANELAGQTKVNAQQGNDRMQEMLTAMRSINEAATNIAKIIKVIDEIAFQTNILALNAAVEAARAGQHGKGFAVVAEEVRNLAGRSAQAAKETAELIEGSIRKIGDGAKIAGQTAASLTQIVGDVTQAADLVKEIANASNEQATGIAQLNQGINQVSKVTQTTTATSEQSASTSEELTSQAEHLREMVGRFRLLS
ncbi:methyl-accepting chemotaxis protein [Hydrogenispora ethanolica]|jgi:methyl-accepting chemotaxis protein|uniref:Methyl-accepting chemotaxis protein n=1 Tax=Hydrogenispora ethanolica TaxID=1082276 RepID=A0A4R1SDU6_HYDET|nr:methyl-accepting chemotaxis protein [Hydrogenispora ethanolica]TCL76832.1 methyl-accepting chemotaxis protein [Hydrogenispora ethanolica]